MKPSEVRAAVEIMRAQLTVVCARIEPALNNTREWSNHGYPTASGPIGGGRGGETSAVEALALSGRADEYAADRHEAEAQLRAARLAVGWLHRFVYRNTETHGLEPVLIDCANPHCERTMTGLPNDRPRDGRCERCYRWRRRNNADWPSGGAAVLEP